MGVLDFSNDGKEVANVGEKTDALSKDSSESGIIEIANTLLEEVSVDWANVNAVRLPLGELSTLGGAVAAMLPAFREITKSVKYTDKGLYKCVFPNGVVGKLAVDHKEGLNLGTIIGKHGIEAQARFIPVSGQTATSALMTPIDPATIAMAAALARIEKKLDAIEEMGKQILSFLEQDKEAKIEGDLKTLTSIVQEYKFNWENPIYVSTKHQIAADIKRSAEANLSFYKKQIAEVLKKTQLIVQHGFIQSQQHDLQKRFKYYRMSLYIYAFASFLEVMLQGNRQQDYINEVRKQVLDRNEAYQVDYQRCYDYLSKLSKESLERGVLRELGNASKSIGSFIGSIPLVKDGQVDEWLVDRGKDLKKASSHVGNDVLSRFEGIKDSGVGIFDDFLNHVNCLFNKTQEICIGEDAVYIIS